MKKQKSYLYLSLFFLALFTIWTLAVSLFDVKEIGPNSTSVGFASLNEAFHKFTGVNMTLYTVTDWLSIIPILFIFGFAMLGFIQLVKRKSLCKVDKSILALGGFYIAVMAAYILFEICVINYRPILIEGISEASYPSSTTMLILTVMPTAAIELNKRIENKPLRISVLSLLAAFSAFMLIARLISGVHWLTDIIGGVMLSAALVFAYCFFSR